jgi:hypothetical protein
MARLQVEGALRAYADSAPRATGRAIAVIDRILRAHEASAWPEIAWRYSSLTADGFPVELTLAANDPSVRWAAEVAPPEVPEPARLEIAFGFAPALDPALAWLERLKTIQSSGSLAYGAWIGGRHAEHTDAFKVYAEVPPGFDAAALTRTTIGDLHGPVLRRSILRMVGVGLADGEAELYFRADGMDAWEIEPLAVAAGVPDRAAELIDLITEVSGRGNLTFLPWSNVGFSVRVGSAGLSVFGVARSFIGPDGAIRARMIETAARRGWSLSGYRPLTRPLAAARNRRTCHGIISFSADGAGVSLRIGVRPPAVNCAADSHNEGVSNALAR